MFKQKTKAGYPAVGASGYFMLPSTNDPDVLKNSKKSMSLKKLKTILDVASRVFHKRAKNQLQILCILSYTEMTNM